jgi:predicted DNA-binding transcriptional regulator AlpA
VTIIDDVDHRSLRFVGAHEIRVLLAGGISRQRVYQLTSRPDFPAPVADLAMGKVWLAEDVEAWIRSWREVSLGSCPPARQSGGLDRDL